LNKENPRNNLNKDKDPIINRTTPVMFLKFDLTLTISPIIKTIVLQLNSHEDSQEEVKI